MCHAAPSAACVPARCEPFLRFSLLPGRGVCHATPSATCVPARCEPISRFPLLPGRRGASSRQSVERAAWNICALWNIAVRTRPIRCAPGPLVRTALNFLLSRAHRRPFYARDRLRAHGEGRSVSESEHSRETRSTRGTELCAQGTAGVRGEAFVLSPCQLWPRAMMFAAYIT